MQLDFSFFLPVFHKESNLIMPTLKTLSQSKEVAVIMFFHFTLDIIHQLAKKISFALKECYKCDGISTRQHNGPGGRQIVWHYHLHVYPRYNEDDLYRTDGKLSAPEDRLNYAEQLRNWFNKNELNNGN